MACASPISTNGPQGPILVRCKQCLQCRIYKQSSLTLRCILENATASSGQFWTLTYRDAPEKGNYSDFSDFLKRLRSWNHRRKGNPIRYLGCGEYGSKSGRFHYHGLIFNALHRPSETCLTKLWPHGFVYIGTVTPASIRYTARYTLKFETKGKESCAGWSKRPPLGSDGMRQIAHYMRDRGDTLECPPSHLKIEGKSYPCDRAMQIEFAEAYNPDWIDTCPDTGHRKLNINNAVQAHTAYLEHFRFGDPIEQQRKHRENRATFFETARFTNGQF